MKIIILFFFLAYIQGLDPIDFDIAMTELSNLEKYVKEYKAEKPTSQTLTHLIVGYIRQGVYSGTEWSIAGGSIPNDLPAYISNKDLLEGTNAQATQTYREIELPNKEKLDFVHLFAVMNGIENGNSYSGTYAHLVGWGGDTCQLFQDIRNWKGNLEELMNITKTYFGKKGQFGSADLISDLDGPILLNKKNDNNNFYEIIKNYYMSQEYLNRVYNFVSLTFPNLKNKDKEKFREEIFKIYNSDSLINILECKYGLRDGLLKCIIARDLKSEYTEHQKAAVYVFSDYLYENFDLIVPNCPGCTPFIEITPTLELTPS